jgi:hypothetical protein
MDKEIYMPKKKPLIPPNVSHLKEAVHESYSSLLTTRSIIEGVPKVFVKH